MNEDQIRENARPLGNVTPLPRMQEPWEPPDEWVKGRSLALEEAIARDRERYGVSFIEMRGDGARRRVDPRAVEPAYPDGPLASRRAPGELMDDEQYAELTRSIRSHHEATGVRIWLVWHGEPEIAEQIASGLREVAETLGFTHLDTTVELMEEGPG